MSDIICDFLLQQYVFVFMCSFFCVFREALLETQEKDKWTKKK